MKTFPHRYHPRRVGWIDLLCVALLAICLLLIGLASRPVVMWGVSASWQPVDATLVDVQITDLLTPEQKKTQQGPYFRRDVIFRYEANGQAWTSTQWGWDLLASSTTNLESAGIVFDRFSARIGKTVTAWVNPHNPAQAVLVREPVWVGVIFRLGGAGIAFLFYLILQMLVSQPNEGARFKRLVNTSLLVSNLVVLIFTFALVLDNHMSGRPFWSLTALYAGFAGFWVWAIRHLKKLQGQGKPIVSWEEWQAKLHAFVNPKTLRNRFAPPVPGQIVDGSLVSPSVFLLAGVLAVSSYAASAQLWPEDTDAQPTQFAVDSTSRRSQFLDLTSPSPAQWLQAEAQVEVASTRDFAAINILTPALRVRLTESCRDHCFAAWSYEIMLAVRRGNSYCGVAFSGVQSLPRDPASDAQAPVLMQLKPHSLPLARNLLQQRRPVWPVLVLNDSFGKSLFLHANAALDLGYPVENGLVGPGDAASVAFTREQRSQLYCPAGKE